MPEPPLPKAGHRRNFANVLEERLSVVAKEHHEWLLEQEDEEVKSLREEVLMLRGEVSKLNHALASSKVAEGIQTSSGPVDIWDANCYVCVDCGQLKRTEQHQPASSESQQDLEASDSPVMILPDDPATCFDAFGENAEFELERKFQELDREQKGYLDINTVAEHLTRNLPSESQERSAQLRKYKVAVLKLNKAIHNTGEHITWTAFQVIMTHEADALRNMFGPILTESLMEIRTGLLQDAIVQGISTICHVRAEDFVEAEIFGPALDKHKRRILRVLEPASGFMICLNAILLGVSLDVNPEWQGWFISEIIFCCFFIGELLTAVYVYGCGQHFLGKDWAWSWFDLLIVCSATVDIILTCVMTVDDSAYSQIMVMRVARLTRVFRLVRILRLKMFKELTLMINGVVAGLRTLFWAIVLLTLFMYVLGVLMRQVMMLEENQKWCDADSNCKRGEKNMEDYSHIMFGSVGRSMLATFTCFTEGCSSPDGTPFIWHLWDTRGPILVIGYIIAFMFISFGVFNLILAVFVEATLSNAREEDAERQFGSQETQLHKANRLFHLLVKLCKASANGEFTQKGPKPRRREGLSKVMHQIMDQLARHRKRTPEMLQPSSLTLKVSQDQFGEVMSDPEVRDLLEELEISSVSLQQLFDILDADNSGFLSINEVVAGVMKLRGPTDKGDIIGTGLWVRDVQKQLRKMDEWLLRRDKIMAKSVQKLADAIEGLNPHVDTCQI